MNANPSIAEVMLPAGLVCRILGHRLSRGYPVAPYLCERCGRDLRDDRPDREEPQP